MNKLLLYSLFLFFLAQATEITKHEGLLVSQKFDSSHLFKTNKGFELNDIEFSKVHDVVLHNCSNIEALEHYDPLLSDSEYSLMARTNLNQRSGVRETAGFWLSKFAVHAIAQTAYALVAGATAFIYPPAAPVVYLSLQLTFAAPVEIVSNMVAYGRAITSYGAISYV
jgi:hypothetical protein